MCVVEGRLGDVGVNATRQNKRDTQPLGGEECDLISALTVPRNPICLSVAV